MGLFDRFRNDSQEPKLVQMKAKRGQSDDEAIASALKKATDKDETVVLRIGRNLIIVDGETTQADAKGYLAASRNGVEPSISTSRELRAHEARRAAHSGDYAAFAPDFADQPQHPANQHGPIASKGKDIGEMGATLVGEVEAFLRDQAAFGDIAKNFKVKGEGQNGPTPPPQQRNSEQGPDQPKRGGPER